MKQTYGQVQSRTGEITERDGLVLQLVVRQYVETAAPIGSEYLVRNYSLPWSSATIRNIFARLEYAGFIEHTHTSSGRKPTEKGYRYFVDTMQQQPIRHTDALAIRAMRMEVAHNENFFREIAQLLGKISGQLSLISTTYTNAGVLHKLELIPLSSTRVLVVLAVKAGFVKTIVLKIHTEIPPERLENVAASLTERLSGRTLSEIRSDFLTYFHPTQPEEASLIHMILAAPGLFDDVDIHSIHVSGTPNVLRQPEFQSNERLTNLLNIIDDESSLISEFYEYLNDALQTQESATPVSPAVRIGSEHTDARLAECSSIAAHYEWDGIRGVIGLIGPTRLQYEQLAPLVSYMATTLTSAI